jgi:hypothetical protein
MSETHDSYCLVEQARLTRLQAKRCRAILRDIDETTAATLLREYAMQLEERAEVLENAWRATAEGAQ